MNAIRSAEPYSGPRVVATDGARATDGRVMWSPVKSLWFFGMLAGWVAGAAIDTSPGAILLFLATSAATLCGGHSIGMHRKLIHQSFDCPKWLERLGVYLGTLVGLGGPFTMMRTHDLRDWAQRQPECHDYYGHRYGFLADAWRQIHCTLVTPPGLRVIYPDSLASDRFYVWLQRTSMLQQLPWAILFFALGGWGWVAWGVCARVVVSISGHWMVGHFAHTRGPQSWRVEGASVQGHDVPFCGVITFGECWHNNHHAFPGSAQLGLYPGQTDPGWIVLRGLERIGLVRNPKRPADLPARPELLRAPGALRSPGRARLPGWTAGRPCRWRRRSFRRAGSAGGA